VAALEEIHQTHLAQEALAELILALMVVVMGALVAVHPAVMA